MEGLHHYETMPSDLVEVFLKQAIRHKSVIEIEIMRRRVPSAKFNAVVERLGGWPAIGHRMYPTLFTEGQLRTFQNFGQVCRTYLKNTEIQLWERDGRQRLAVALDDFSTKTNGALLIIVYVNSLIAQRMKYICNMTQEGYPRKGEEGRPPRHPDGRIDPKDLRFPVFPIVQVDSTFFNVTIGKTTYLCNLLDNIRSYNEWNPFEKVNHFDDSFVIDDLSPTSIGLFLEQSGAIRQRTEAVSMIEHTLKALIKLDNHKYGISEIGFPVDRWTI